MRQKVLKTSFTDVHANNVIFCICIKYIIRKIYILAYIKLNKAFRYYYGLTVQYAHTWKKNTDFLSNIVSIQSMNDSHPNNAPFTWTSKNVLTFAL